MVFKNNKWIPIKLYLTYEKLIKQMNNEVASECKLSKCFLKTVLLNDNQRQYLGFQLKYRNDRFKFYTQSVDMFTKWYYN